MSFNIAVAGKGGSGKTTLASLIIRYLMKNGPGPVLGVDADPNANLGDSLGLEVKETIGSVLALFQKEKIKIPPGMTKEAYLDVRLNSAIVESKGLDLVTMGRGEGRDCYCYPNTVLRRFIDTLSGNYVHMVMDNEAGMEHLSRATTQNVDALLLVSDHTVKGVRTVARIRELVKELELVVRRQLVVINYVPGEIDPAIRKEMAKLAVSPAAIILRDEEVYSYDLRMIPLLELPDTSPAVQAVNDLMANVLNPEVVQPH